MQDKRLNNTDLDIGLLVVSTILSLGLLTGLYCVAKKVMRESKIYKYNNVHNTNEAVMKDYIKTIAKEEQI